MKIKYQLQKNARNILVKKTKIKKSQKHIINDVFPGSVTLQGLKGMPIYGYTLQNIVKDDVLLSPSIYTALLHNVIYYAERDSIFTSNKKLISDSVMDHFKPEKYSLRKLHLARQEEIHGLCSVFRSMFSYRNYYHTLIDHLPRIYLLKQYYQRYGSSEKVKLLVPGNLTNVENFFLSRLLSENIEILRVEPDKVFRIDNLIFPSFLTHRNAGYLPRAYLDFFCKNILPAQPRNKKNLIYISRKFIDANSQRCILNEKELLKKLETYGFKEYHLEDMSVDEQIELFYNASFVVSPHGAGLTNIIFSEAINVLEMFPGSCLLPHYYFLSKSLGHNYTYWCSQTGTNQNSNFLVEIDKIIEIVRNLL